MITVLFPVDDEYSAGAKTTFREVGTIDVPTSDADSLEDVLDRAFLVDPEEAGLSRPLQVGDVVRAGHRYFCRTPLRWEFMQTAPAIATADLV